MTGKASAFLAVLLLSFSAHGEALDPMIAHDPFAYYGQGIGDGREIGDVQIEGVSLAPELMVKIRGAVRVGQKLWLPGVQRAVGILFNDASPGRRPSRVTVTATPRKDNKVNVRFILEPTRRIAAVTIEGDTSIERTTLLQAANMPLGAAFWPDDAEAAARRIAAAYFREGWRDANVGWEAHPGPGEDEVTIAFGVAEGAPTTLVELEFSGEKGLTDSELYAAFNLSRGDRLRLDAVDEGLANLLGRYREKHYYLARVSRTIEAADARAVVEIQVVAGPRFRLQVRGNRTFPEKLLLSMLRYNGDDPLDPAVERDLGNRLAEFYWSAGFPTAHVDICENVPGVVGCINSAAAPPGDKAAPGEHLVTFLITEGKPVRVVERRFEGLTFAAPDFAPARLLQHIDDLLSDVVPSEVTTDPDNTQRRKVDESPSEMTRPSPYRVAPSEVLLVSAYAQAAKDIQGLYQLHGFLGATVDEEPRVEEIAPGRVRLTIVIHEGPQVRFRSVRYVTWKEFNPAQAIVDDDSDYLPLDDVRDKVNSELSQHRRPTVEPGQPVSGDSLESMRKAIIDFYKNRAHLFVKVDYREVATDSEDAEDVIFGVRAGKEVRVASIEIKGATHTSQRIILNALRLVEDDPTKHVPCVFPDDDISRDEKETTRAPPADPDAKSTCVTPKGLERSVRHLLDLQIFKQVGVDIADPDREDMPNQRLIVQVQEGPSYSVDPKAGLSLADGPRGAVSVLFGNLGKENKSVGFTAKLNYPVFRYNGLFVAQNCGGACTPKSDPVERYIALTFGSPIYLADRTIDQHYDLVNENKVRPAYQLESSSAVATFNNLLKTSIETRSSHIKEVKLAASVQSDIEYDNFTPFSGVNLAELPLVDQKALLLPHGEVALVSVRPTLSFDARDNSVDPTMGFFMSLGLDVSKSLPFLETENPVQLFRGLLNMSGYIPIYTPRRPGARGVRLALSARLGGIEHAGPASEVIATKRFFLGGTGSMRGFDEDDLVPEDERATIHQAIVRCRSLISGGTCGSAANGQPLDPTLLAIATGTGVSTGGDYMILARAELKFEVVSWMDAAVFIDAGNLWVEASDVNPLDLRTAVGGAVSVPLPIGPAEFGVGVNLHPDTLLQEPSYRIFLSIGAF